MTPDENLFFLKRLASGDSKAHNELMNNYYQILCAYAFTLIKNHVEAEDIVQNVFVSIWTNRKQLKNISSIKSYLFRSVYNEFVDQYRKKKPLLYLEKKHIDTLSQVAEEQQENLDELVKRVNLEINRLPKKCRQTFILNKKEGLTHTEISEHLGISVKTR